MDDLVDGARHGDPPRKIVKRYLPWFPKRRAQVNYYALYHMNVTTAQPRLAFMDQVEAAMARLA
jgi:NAD(P)H dehydrogenase (quinone)